MQGCHLKLPINVIARPFAPAFFQALPNKTILSGQTATKFRDKFREAKFFCAFSVFFFEMLTEQKRI